MPSYQFGNYLASVISVHFPGGLKGFAQAGCDVDLVPMKAHKDILYILLPSESTSKLDLRAFKKAIEEHSEKQSVILRFVTEPNFKGRDFADVKEELTEVVRSFSEALQANIFVMVRSVVLVVATVEEENAKSIAEALAAVKGLRRVAVVHEKGCIEREYPVTDEPVTGEPKETSTPSFEDSAPQQKLESDKRPINASDIADICSLLEHSKDVTEFLTKI
jgi:hypothetical protein